MPHLQRNLNLLLFMVLPIFGFLLGWTLSVYTDSSHVVDEEVVSVEINTEKDEVVENIKPEPIKRHRELHQNNVDLDIFWETWNAVKANHLRSDDMKVQDQVYGATKGLIKSVGDPYTVFMSPEDTKKFEESLNGEFEGIGAEIAIKDEKLTVVSPLKGSPAELAGIKSGDYIYQVNGEPTFGTSIEEAVTRIRGPKGEKVTLTVIRESLNKPLDIVIVRDQIVIDNLEWEMNDDIAILTIHSFGTNVVKEFNDAVTEILLEDPAGMVVDVRNNGGGLLDASIRIMTEFMPNKIVVRTKGRRFGNTGDIKAGREGALAEIPLVVLANEGSASASEIFVGAVQDHKRGAVLGAKTFGKGSVQNVLPLSDGSSLKVTIAEWLTPGGRMIHEKGIAPHEVVERTEEDYENDVDPVIDRAFIVLRNEEILEELINSELKGEVAETENEASADTESEEEAVTETTK